MLAKTKLFKLLSGKAKDMPPLKTTDTQQSFSSTPQNHDDNDLNKLEIQRNKLLNQQLSERVERDIQRKRHRDAVIGVMIVICIVFYTSFLSIVWDGLRQNKLFENISVAWAVPLMALVTVPTILLVILIFCVYRQRPVLPSDIIRLLQRISPEQ